MWSAPLELLAVVGHVRQQIGRVSAALHEYTVALEPERGGPKPDGAVRVVDEARGPQVGERLLDVALGVEVHLVREDVERDAEIGEAGADVLEDPGLCVPAAEIRRIFALGEVHAVLAQDLVGQVDDVRPLIAVARKQYRETVDLGGPVRLVGAERFGRRGGGPAQPFERAGADGVAEYAHLASAVVEVVLARDLVPRRLQQTREHVADHRLAPVAQGQRAGGIGGHELDLGAQAPAGLGAAEFRSEFQHETHQVLPAGLRQPQVQEARSGDLTAGHEPARGAELGGQPIGDRPGRLTQPLGHEHGHVAGEVAVVRALRHVERKIGQRTGVARRVEKLAERLPQPFGEPLLHLGRGSLARHKSSRNPGT